MNRNLIAATCALAAGGGATGVVAIANAADAPPTVTITAAARSLSVQGAEGLKAGPTRFVMKSKGKGERGLILFRLRPGVTRAQIAKAAGRIQDPGDARRYGRFSASTFLMPGTAYTTTINLVPAEYVVVDYSGRPVVRGGFTVGSERSTAVAPVADADVGLRDYGFTGPSTLPRSGTLRVTNDGRVLHHALAFPLRKGASSKALLRRLRSGKEPSEKDFAGPPTALVEIVSPGAENLVETKLKPGRTLLVCFLQDGPKKPPHSALGMARVVTVR